MSKKYICTAEVEVYAINRDDALNEIIIAMDDHEIDWDIEEAEGE